MNDNSPTGRPGPLEILAQWEGPAIHEPGVLVDEQQLAAGSNVAELVAWLSQTATSRVIDNPAYAGIRAKVLGVLSAWRQRFGQARMDEVKQLLLQEMEKYRAYRKITDEELRQRIDRLFAEVSAESSSGKDSAAP
jgi:hypothetical protein